MSFSKKAATFCAVASLFAVSAVNAEEISGQPDIAMAGKWLFNGSYEKVSFDEAVADAQYVDSSANQFSFDAEYYFSNNLSGLVGLGFISYDDNNSFSQETENIYSGDDQTSDSSATGIPLYFDLGYTQFFNTSLPTYVTARGGFATMVASERSIDNCSDCYSEDIDIDAGAYALVGAGINLARIFTVGVFYKNYLSGDIENAVGVKFSFGNFRTQ